VLSTGYCLLFLLESKVILPTSSNETPLFSLCMSFLSFFTSLGLSKQSKQSVPASCEPPPRKQLYSWIDAKKTPCALTSFADVLAVFSAYLSFLKELCSVVVSSLSLISGSEIASEIASQLFSSVYFVEFSEEKESDSSSSFSLPIFLLSTSLLSE